MAELGIRLIFSLAVVVGLLLLTTKLWARRFSAPAGAPIKVLHRQALSRNSAVALIEVNGHALVIGTTDHNISVLKSFESLEPVEPIQPGPFPVAPAVSEIEHHEAVPAPITPSPAPAAATTPSPLPSFASDLAAAINGDDLVEISPAARSAAGKRAKSNGRRWARKGDQDTTAALQSTPVSPSSLLSGTATSAADEFDAIALAALLAETESDRRLKASAPVASVPPIVAAPVAPIIAAPVETATPIADSVEVRPYRGRHASRRSERAPIEVATGPLAGSALSPATWKQAAAAIKELAH